MFPIESFIRDHKKVKLRRVMTEKQREQSRERMQELINACGGRVELAEMINYEMDNLGHPNEKVDAQDISNCIYREKVTPQIAVRIEKTLSDKRGLMRFKKKYLCPDLNDFQFNRVERSMFLDSFDDAS